LPDLVPRTIGSDIAIESGSVDAIVAGLGGIRDLLCLCTASSRQADLRVTFSDEELSQLLAQLKEGDVPGNSFEISRWLTFRRVKRGELFAFTS
jgi:hypothetical protein